MNGETNLAELTRVFGKISTVNGSTAIKSTGVILTPGEKIREMISNAKFQKD